ncbi:hypothetical protein BJ165DRAFT_135713 [Panaeolus papilionaceus]|nr:hypothetical protein BJ165DRAFT_135713 [Panaeolus papilionaceus]
MTITGLSAIVECRSENEWLPTIGVRGSGVLDFGKHISENPIEESVAIFIKTSDLGLGFEIRVKSWRSMFGIHGMDFESVILEAAFPPEQFPVPSEFTIAGKVKLHINNAKIDGDVNVHVIEEDLTSSYAKGSISGLYLSDILGVFSDIDFGPPGYLDAGYGPLVFIIVPKDMRDRNGDPLKQQFKMSGSMQLPIIHFKADIEIDITPGRLHIDGNLSPITIPYVPEKLFSILASPHEGDASNGSPKGASIYIHIGDKDKPVDANVSGMISLLGMSNEVDITISETGLKFLLAQDVWTKRGSFNGELNSTRLMVHADYEFALDIVIPDFSLDGIKFDIIHIFNFSGKLDVEVVWKNVAWNLVITGHFELFGLRFDKTLSVGADFQDLVAIGKKIASVIKTTFGTDLVAGLKALGEDISKALHILKDFGLSIANRVKVLVDSCGKALAPVLDAAKKAFDLAWNEVAVVLREIGKTAEEAAKVLEEICSKAYDIAVAIGKAFGATARKLCAKILREAKHAVSEIAQ